MPALEDRAHVEGDEVAFLELALARDAMYDLVVHRGTDDARIGWDAAHRTIALEVGGGSAASELTRRKRIQLAGGHAGMHSIAQHSKDCHHDLASATDARDLGSTSVG